MVMVVMVNGKFMEPGCYVDGYHGQYMPDLIGELAQQVNPNIGDDMCPRFWRDTANRYETTGQNGAARWAWDQYYEQTDWVIDQLSDCTEGGYWECSSEGFFLVAHDAEGAE